MDEISVCADVNMDCASESQHEETEEDFRKSDVMTSSSASSIDGMSASQLSELLSYCEQTAEQSLLSLDHARASSQPQASPKRGSVDVSGQTVCFRILPSLKTATEDDKDVAPCNSQKTPGTGIRFIYLL